MLSGAKKIPSKSDLDALKKLRNFLYHNFKGAQVGDLDMTKALRCLDDLLKLHNTH